MKQQATTEHTELPWHARRPNGKFDLAGCDWSAENSEAAQTEWVPIRGPNREVIALVVHCDDGPFNTDTDPTLDANAAFIVRACNAHDELVAALDRLANVSEACARDGDDAVPESLRNLTSDDVAEAIYAARAAVAKAQAVQP